MHITVTPEGEQAFRVCSGRTDEFLADLFHEFSTEEVQTLWTLLQKLYRFDGKAEDDPQKHIPHNADDVAQILSHHPNFLKRRANNPTKENQST